MRWFRLRNWRVSWRLPICFAHPGMPGDCSMRFAGQAVGERSRRRSTGCGGRWGLGRAAERDAVFHAEFREDLHYWVKTDRETALRIFELLEAVLKDPFTGIGKPEPLKYLLAGCWSRRITQEHRLVYRVSKERIDFLQARYHY